ncbi:MAG: ribosome maturation factor RimM [Burkholderiaceae bacterium]
MSTQRESNPRISPPADLVSVGRILGAYGVRGWVRIDPFAGHQSVLHDATHVWLKGQGKLESFQVLQIKEHSGQLVASIAVASIASPDNDKPGEKVNVVVDRDYAASLKGREILVSRADFPPADDNEFYWVDLIGCAVDNIHGEHLGEVVRMEDHGADPVMRIEEKPDDRTEIAEPGAQSSARVCRVRLIPFVAAFVTEVSLDRRRITVNWDTGWD